MSATEKVTQPGVSLAADRAAVAPLLAAAADVFADREMAVVREITKVHEECRTGTAAELLAFFSAEPPKGELVLVVANVRIQLNECFHNLIEIQKQIIIIKKTVCTLVFCVLAGNFVYFFNAMFKLSVLLFNNFFCRHIFIYSL